MGWWEGSEVGSNKTKCLSKKRAYFLSISLFFGIPHIDVSGLFKGKRRGNVNERTRIKGSEGGRRGRGRRGRGRQEIFTDEEKG